MIVDCHTHTWDSASRLGEVSAIDKDAAWLTAAGPQDHLLATAGVDRCLVLGFISRHLGAEIPNELIAEYVAEHPEKMIGLAGADPTDDGALEQLTEDVERLKMRGMVLSPAAAAFHPADTRAMQLYELADSLKLPVIIHTGPSWSPRSAMQYSHPSLLDEVARSFPNLKLVVARMGYPWLDETLVLLNKHPNVFADVGHLLRRPWQAYRALIGASEFGVVDKLLFGSGFPFATATACIETLYQTNLLPHGTNLPCIPRERLRGIVERNALELLGIVDVAPAPPPTHEELLDTEEDEQLTADPS